MLICTLCFFSFIPVLTQPRVFVVTKAILSDLFISCIVPFGRPPLLHTGVFTGSGTITNAAILSSALLLDLGSNRVCDE